jgi:hypothetical protein
MPKNNEVEYNAMDRGLSEEGDDISTGGKEKQLSKKQLGRLESKKALLRKDTVKVGEGCEEETILKRARSNGMRVDG